MSGYTNSNLIKLLRQGSNILREIKTVDGTGSGLDADLLDGSHKIAFQERNNILMETGDSLLTENNYYLTL
jgi:hypothetical protein